ncbi:MAG: MFS transporter permease [Deltaproteobacteria bacterium]|nr:MFS transporter permease [Deltaproteobacteria bacterium]
MADKPREIVIEKEDAVFHMDAHGCWKNRHGRFRHKKVIDYFNTCIRKDRHGFYLTQQQEDTVEKVYFPYEETAYFVFDVVIGDTITLVLNTGQRLELNPDQLYIKSDCLYVYDGQDLIKFTDRSMMKMAVCMEDRDGLYTFVFRGRRSAIKTTEKFSDGTI